jgi:hypothetical protein
MQYLCKNRNVLNYAYVIDLGGGIPKLGPPFMLQAGLLAPLQFQASGASDMALKERLDAILSKAARAGDYLKFVA